MRWWLFGLLMFWVGVYTGNYADRATTSEYVGWAMIWITAGTLLILLGVGLKTTWGW